ncbi:MAG: alpha-L-fucosidase, partial [Acidimicrobiaceae bacterium]|nr:alpha-L-fucosidase [Acidimicrobiaceae bacterium]
MFSALDDSVVDEAEKVTIGFGVLPSGVTAGDPAATVVSIVDDDRRVLQAHMADERTSPDGPTDNGAAPDYSSVGGIDAGDWLRFYNVSFDEAPDVLMVSLAAAAAGGTIEVRLDSTTGPKVATLTIASTGSSSRFGVQYASVSGISAGSTRDVFFVFPSATGANVNWFVFGEDPAGETTAEFDERMRWWRDAKFGQFIHWGAYAQLEGYWGDQPADADKCKDAEWIMISCKISLSDYESEAAAKLNPSDFNAKEWARKAKEAGQKYVVITSKHHDGFSMFDTNVRGFEAKSCGTGRSYDVVDHTTGSCSATSDGSGWGRDPLVELAEAVRAEGLVFAVYYSTWDWHYRFLSVGFYGNSAGADWAPIASPEDHLPAMREQLRELVEKLDPALFWFDGEWNPPWSAAHGRELYKFMRVLSPDAIINDRVGTRRIHKNGVGDYDTVAEHRGPTYVWPDWENSQTMTARWGYTRHDTDMKPHSQFAEELFANVSRNGNYLLNVAPTETGALTKVNVDGLVAIGAWLDTHGSAVFDVLKPNPLRPYVPPWGYYTTGKDKSTVYAGVYTWPSNGQLTLEYLDATVTKAVLLSDPDTEYNFHTVSGQTIVTGLPASAPAGVLLPVLALSVKGEPKTQAGANLALDHKTVTGSPTAYQDPAYSDADWYSAERAFDGSLASRWVLRNTRTSWSRASAPTLTLTLKQSQTFNRIELRELNNAVVRGFVIQYHDGTNWVDLHTGTTIGITEFHEIDFAPVTSDRLRLLITSKTSHEWLNIAEFAIYNVPTITSLAYGRSVATDSSRGTFVNSNVVDGDDTTYWHASSGSTTGHLTVTLDGAQVFDRVVLKEPAGLQRVTGFKVQYRKGGAWVDLHTGTTIGDSLEVIFAPVSSGRVRLLITGASGSPAVSEFEVWNEARGVLAGFAESSYEVAEGGAAATVTVELSDAPQRSVTIPLVVTYSGGASAADVSGIPASVTFAAGESSKSFTVTATDDRDDDDGESVAITLGTYPAAVSTWNNRAAKIPITDNDDPSTAGATFTPSSVSVAENSGEASYTVVLDSRPTADVTVALSVSGPVKIDGPDPATTFTDTEMLTFTTTSWDRPQTVRVQGQNDALENPGGGRSARITHDFSSSDTAYNALVDGVVPVTVTDDDQAKVFFSSASTLSVAESDDPSTSGTREDQTTVTVALSRDPGRSVTVPLTVTATGRANEADYSGVPESVVFASGETSKSFVFDALDDTVVDEYEKVTIGFGTLPSVVIAGDPAETEVFIVDDDRRVLQAHMADERTSPNGPTDNGAAPDYSSVGGIDAGDYLRFNNVKFAEAPDILMVSLAAVPADAGDTIEVRLGSVSGTKAATLTIASTGNSSRFGVQYASVSKISAGSTHDLFFVFPSATGANINWFVFGEDPAGETTSEFDERMRWWRDAKFGQF